MKKQQRKDKKALKLKTLLTLMSTANGNNESAKETVNCDSKTNGTTKDISRKSKNSDEDLQKPSNLGDDPEGKLNGSTSVTDKELKDMKRELAKHNSALRNVPKFRLKTFGEKAALTTRHDHRAPLMLDDIQYLLMSALIGSSSPFKPDRWCVLEKTNKITHTVVLVIEGLTAYTYMAHESLFVETKTIFEHQMEVVLPKYERNRIVEELSSVPLTQSYKEKLIKQYGSMEAAMTLNKEHHLIAKSVFPIDSDGTDDDSEELPDGENFPRTRLLLSPLQMMIEDYPMPLKGAYEDKFRDYRFTCSSYKPVTKTSPMYGLDCEMVRTIKAENELARVSIVDENYKSIYETLVRPDNKIINYLTPWSGITKEMMDNVSKTLKEVQDEVHDLLPRDAILVGQSLNCDLKAMKMMHPYVIDTSCIFNESGDRNRKSKLQHFVKLHLGEDIQKSVSGHSSIEDSTYSLKLTKLKLSKDIYFGDVALQEKRNIEDKKAYTGIAGSTEPAPPEQTIATSLLSNAMKRRKKSAIVTTHRSDLELGKFYSKNQKDLLKKAGEGDDDKDHGILHHKESTAKDVIKKTREVILTNDFNLSHFNVFEDHPDETVTEENIASIIPKVDKWISKLYSNVAANGLFVVIFGGHEKNTKDCRW